MSETATEAKKPRPKPPIRKRGSTVRRVELLSITVEQDDDGLAYVTLCDAEKAEVYAVRTLLPEYLTQLSSRIAGEARRAARSVGMSKAFEAEPGEIDMSGG